MRRFRFFSLVLSIFVLLSTLPAFSAVKAGATCSRAGKVATKSGKEFRCVKSGTRLVWRVVKRAPLPTPTQTQSTYPTPTPTPSTSPSGSPTPSPSPSETSIYIPIPLPSITERPLTFRELLWSKEKNGTFPIEREVFEIPTEIPTSWQDVYEKRVGIPYRAWLAVSKNIASNSSKLGKVELLVGPNTTLNHPGLVETMELVSRAVPSGPNPKNVRVFAFSFKDAKWADENFKRLYADESARFKMKHSDPVWEICRIPREACFAQSFIDSQSNGVIILGMIDRGSIEQRNQTYSEYARAYRGVLVAHEYLHTIEAILLGDRRYIAMERTPTWFSQGTAVFMEGTAPNHESFDQFMRFRLTDSKLLYPDCSIQECIKVDAALVQDYLSISHQVKNWDNFPYAMKYEMSARVVEILVALKGPDSFIEMFRAIGQGRAFDKAFESVYGIPYEEAKPIIARIVADQFANGR